jgi:copper chaperone CopZ
MRTLSFVWFATAACLAGGGVALAEERSPAPPAKPEVRLEFVYLEISGVEGAEASAVSSAMTGVAGVRSFAWTVGASEAKVVREVGKADDASLARVATSAGAERASVVPLAATTFTFEKKLHCGGCVASVNRTLRAVRGVKESTVSAEMTTVTAVYDTRAVKPGDVEAALVAIGKPAKAAR